jgi:hypothetical protein
MPFRNPLWRKNGVRGQVDDNATFGNLCIADGLAFHALRSDPEVAQRLGAAQTFDNWNAVQTRSCGVVSLAA